MVTNAFRLRVWLGLYARALRRLLGCFVTNAFRLRVWLGRTLDEIAGCLAMLSPMPFG